MSASTVTPSGPEARSLARPDTTKVKRAATSSFLGSMLEYYDFYIYASAAALIFPTVFFPDSGHAALLSLATFGVAYVARPLGAVVLGHFGDRVGRKKIMLLTLIMMGAATFLIGCIPSADSIGVLAPILLVLMRIAQGISAAGEQSGASSLTLEHAPEGRRAFFCSWTLNGTQAGFILASLVFLPIAALPDDILYTWGWRIPFWGSLIVLVAAYIMRLKLEEPEEFTEQQESKAVAKLPVADLLRTHSANLIRVICCAFIAVVSTIFSVFGLAFATTEEVGIPKSTMLWVAIAANAVALLSQPAWAMLSDRIGRRPLFIGGALGSAVFIYVYFGAIASGNVPLIFLAAIGLMSVFYAAPNAIWPSFYSEMFNTKVRYSGIAIGTQVGFALAGFAPAIGNALMGGDKTHWMPVAILTSVACVICAISAFTAKETFRTPLKELGNPI
ncbi:MHS family MFS transporter [Rhodococcus sp. P-2]|uniref:MFS transporter n=1 Tax=Rhodococcus sp. P-2 TaxID=2795031 RepID=UPI001906B3A7|nr:MFS transporter [Rhodococcus sp. P-2]QQM20148.1 MHS family MFS transporter [Rhodococcus sp. P-2]